MTDDRAYYCYICGDDAEWTITRHGDVAVRWACATHLHHVASTFTRRGLITKFTLERNSFGVFQQVQSIGAEAGVDE